MSDVVSVFLIYSFCSVEQIPVKKKNLKSESKSKAVTVVSQRFHPRLISLSHSG